jgi:hypothetical protein
MVELDAGLLFESFLQLMMNIATATKIRVKVFFIKVFIYRL